MAYGIEVSNKSGRVLFSTENDYGVMRAGSAVNVYTDGSSVPSTLNDEIIIARPNNGEDGVIATNHYIDPVSGTSYSYEVFGRTSSHQSWGAARGYKYRKVRPVKSAFTPASSGYGAEVYASNGTDLIFSNNVTNIAVVEFAFQSVGGVFRWKNNGRYNFNEIYVGLEDNFIIDSLGISSPFFNYSGGRGGQYCHFDDTNEEITIVNAFTNANTADGWDKYGTGNPPLGTIASASTMLVYRVIT